MIKSDKGKACKDAEMVFDEFEISKNYKPIITLKTRSSYSYFSNFFNSSILIGSKQP